MDKKLLMLVMALAWAGFASAQAEYQLNYVDRYKTIAIREMERAGIPASIKLAQGILESDAGRSDLARRANNHFGIKCGGNWNGKKVYKRDDDYDEKGRLIESCFRVYRNVEASFIAHSEFLRDPKKVDRYGFLFRLDPTDYRRWARGLKRAGYATSATYDNKLINIIETFELYKYDRMTSVDLISDTDFSPEGYLSLNDVNYILAEEDETVTEIARRTDTTLRRLVKYNENIDDSDQRLDEGTKVFLQPKRNAFRGKKTWHYVQEGESMFDISQHYGVKMNKLYKRNRMTRGTEPATNERIKLRGCKVKERPALSTEKTEELPMPELLLEGDEMEMDTIEIDLEEPFIPEEPIEEEPFTPLPPVTEPVKPARDTVALPPVVKPDQETDAGDEESLDPIQPKPVPKPPVTPVPDKPVDNKPDEGFDNSGQPVAPPATGAVYHTVQTGDTLWNISRRYDTTVEELIRLNNLKDNNIKVGQKIRVK